MDCDDFTTSSSSESELEEESKKSFSAEANPSRFTVDNSPSLFLKLDNSKKTETILEKPSAPHKNIKLSSSLQPGIKLSGGYLNIYPHRQPLEANTKFKQLSLQSKINEFESKNVISQPGFEKQYTIPPYKEGRRKIKRGRMKERDKTKGPSWFNMPATEVTEEIKNDLAVLQMRNSLNPKHFYKRGNEKICPKYFRVGTVVETPIDFYCARIPKKQRKQTLVEELLADAEFRKYQKKKYGEALKNQPQKFIHSSQKKKETKKKNMNMEATTKTSKKQKDKRRVK